MPFLLDNPPKPDAGMGFLLLFDEFIAFHSASRSSTSAHMIPCIPCPAHPHPHISFLTSSLPSHPHPSLKPTFQIRTRTKRPPFPRNNPNPQSRLVVKPSPDRVQLDVPCRVDAVQRFRSVESDEEDVSWGGIGEGGQGRGGWRSCESCGRHGLVGEGGGG